MKNAVILLALLLTSQVAVAVQAGGRKPLPVLKKPVPMPGQPSPIPQPGPNPAQGSVQFVVPRANDTFAQGQQVQLRWNASGQGAQPCFQLYLFQGQALVREISNQWGSQTFPWTVPADLSGGGFRIRLRTCDQALHAESPTFAILSSKADVAVQVLDPTPVQPTSADEIRIRFRVTNQGQAQADGVSARLTLVSPDPQVHKEFVFFGPQAMPFSDHRLFEQKIRVNRKGVYTYSIVASAINVEGPKDNNTASGSITVLGAPDLVVFLYDLISIDRDMHYDLPMAVWNFGEAPAAASKLRYWIDHHGTKTYDVPPLAPGAYALFKRDYHILTYGSDLYSGEADFNGQVTESRETNNKHEGTVWRRKDWQEYYNQPSQWQCGMGIYTNYQQYQARPYEIQTVP